MTVQLELPSDADTRSGLGVEPHNGRLFRPGHQPRPIDTTHDPTTVQTIIEACQTAARRTTR